MADREIKEAKSLRWLAVQFPKVENPKDDVDKMQNCINLYCTSAADLIDHQQAEIEGLQKLLYSFLDTRNGDLVRITNTELEIIKKPIRAEAIKEFVERLDRKFAFSSDTQCISAKTIRKFIQDELKEMVGVDNG